MRVPRYFLIRIFRNRKSKLKIGVIFSPNIYFLSSRWKVHLSFNPFAHIGQFIGKCPFSENNRRFSSQKAFCLYNFAWKKFLPIYWSICLKVLNQHQNLRFFVGDLFFQYPTFFFFFLIADFSIATCPENGSFSSSCFSNSFSLRKTSSSDNCCSLIAENSLTSSSSKSPSRRIRVFGSNQANAKRNGFVIIRSLKLAD